MTHACEEIRERLHDWMDDTLDDAERSLVRSHLEECSGCRDELAAFERLRSEAAALPSEIRPARDLWPAIESRLGRPWWRRLVPARGGELWPSMPVLAAGAALLALALGVSIWRTQSAPTTPREVVAVEAATQSDTAFAAQAELARSEDGMLLARRDLLEAVQRQKDHLSPETVAVLEENMRIIDQAIGQIRSALEDDPLNQQLHLLLAAHYQQEAELLMLVSGV